MRVLRGGRREPVLTTSLPRRARAAAWIVALVLAVGVAVAGASVDRLLAVRDDRANAEQAADEAGRDERASQAELVAQLAFGAEAAIELEAARAALAAADDALDVAALERAAVAAEIEATRSELARLQDAVTGATGQAFANADTVSGLAECLDGVSELVNQLAVGDHTGAVRTADAIAPACAAVGAAIA